MAAQPIIPFSFENHSVRVIVADNGEPLFVGKDLCIALGYANPAKAMNDHCKGVTKRYPLSTAGGTQEVRVLTEGDMFRLIVNSKLPSAEAFERLVFDEILPTIRKTGRYEAPQPIATGLPQLRKARAMDIATKTAERVFAQLPNLSQESKQTIYANLLNPIAEKEVIALPRLTERTYTAGEVGERLNISANLVGRLANMHHLKTSKYGRFVLDKARHSEKQVEVFRYNEAGIEKIASLLTLPPAVTHTMGIRP